MKYTWILMILLMVFVVGCDSKINIDVLDLPEVNGGGAAWVVIHAPAEEVKKSALFKEWSQDYPGMAVYSSSGKTVLHIEYERALMGFEDVPIQRTGYYTSKRIAFKESFWEAVNEVDYCSGNELYKESTGEMRSVYIPPVGGKTQGVTVNAYCYTLTGGDSVDAYFKWGDCRDNSECADNEFCNAVMLCEEVSCSPFFEASNHSCQPKVVQMSIAGVSVLLLLVGGLVWWRRK